jgi:hypothetical protein
MRDETYYRPPRMSLTNITSGETLEAQANPVTLTESVTANWQDETVPGLSHQPSQFSHTSNFAVSFELHYMVSSINAMADAERARRFLLSLAYPIGMADEVGSAGPPRVLLVWPHMLSLTCTVRSVQIAHQRFNRRAQSVEFRAQLQVAEIRDRRLTSEQAYDDDELRLG